MGCRNGLGASDYAAVSKRAARGIAEHDSELIIDRLPLYSRGGTCGLEQFEIALGRRMRPSSSQTGKCVCYRVCVRIG
jgi:hypothetical protein